MPRKAEKSGDVRSAIDQLARSVGNGFMEVGKRFDEVGKRFDRVDVRLDDIQEQITRIETYILRDHQKRLETIESKLGIGR